MNSEMTQFTQTTPIIDYDNPTVSAFAKENAGASFDHMEQAVSLYYAAYLKQSSLPPAVDFLEFRLDWVMLMYGTIYPPSVCARRWRLISLNGTDIQLYT